MMQFTAPYTVIPTRHAVEHWLHSSHFADLRASGLDDETIRAAGVYSLRPRDLVHFFSAEVPHSIETALCFPYQGGNFARIKLFPPVGKMKYAQPPKSAARLYTPLTVRSGEIIVTEGEKKTLSAQQAGFNAVGIGGVWNWLSSGAPISDLNLVPWDGREVTIIPDSDVFSRVDLMRAIYALGRELQSRGAMVYIAQIPQPTNEKVGLDDFLVAGGSVNQLELFSIGHRIFKPCGHWYARWKFQNAVRAAA